MGHAAVQAGDVQRALSDDALRNWMRVQKKLEIARTCPQPAAWPTRVGSVMLAGGAQYRRVMRAALARRYGPQLPALQETTGGIGMQRSQLGAFLDRLKPAFHDQIGQQANGTPLHRAYGRIADMLDAASPRYACTRARLAARRNRYGRPRF